MPRVSASQVGPSQRARRFHRLPLGGGCALALALVSQDAGPRAVPLSTPLRTAPKEIASVSEPKRSSGSDVETDAEHRTVARDTTNETPLSHSFDPAKANSVEPAAVGPRVHSVVILASSTPPIALTDRPVANITLPAPREILARGKPELEVEPAIKSQTRPAEPFQVEQAAPVAPPVAVRSDAYIAQISTDLMTDPLTFAEATDATQVVPDLALAKMERQRVAMLATAPALVTLRAGDDFAGEVAIAMVSDDTIGVRLADLLDIVGSRMDAERMNALRASSAAQSFVTLDQLRAADLTISYDPVYDELHLDG